MSPRVIIGALVLLVGCATEVPTTFGPGLGGSDDDDDSGGTGVLTSGITAGAGESGMGPDAATDGVDPPTTGDDGSSTTGVDLGTTAGEDAAGESTAGAVDGSSSTSDGVVGEPLDADLDVPEDGDECDTPGSSVECPFLEVCRFYSSEQNMCEGCDTCGNLGALCNEGTDCDILFVCFEHQCTNICELGTYACGPIEDCVDVGHPTHGACDPSAI